MAALYRRGNVYWTKVYVNGRPVRESTGTTSIKKAKRILDDRAGRVSRGEPVLPRADKVRFQEAVGDLRQHYRTTGPAVWRRRSGDWRT